MAAGGEGSKIEQGGFLLLLALVTVALALIVSPFAAPLLWATLAAIMFQPLFQKLLLRMPSNPSRCALAALIIIFFAVLLPAFWIGSMVVDEAAGVVLAFQRGEIDVASWFAQVMAALPANLRTTLVDSGWTDMAVLQSRAQEFLATSAGLIARQAVAVGGGVFSFVLAFGIGLYVTYFLLRDGKSIGATITRALPLAQPIAERLVTKFLEIVRATIKGSVVVGLVQGALGAITFWIVGMPSIVLFGVLMAIFSLLPALGPAIVWAPVAVYLLATGAIWEGVLVIFSGVVIIGMADNLLRPILVGRDTGIPDWIILVTTLGGIAMFGLSGIVLGPLAAGLFLACWSILAEQRGVSAPAPAEQ